MKNLKSGWNVLATVVGRSVAYSVVGIRLGHVSLAVALMVALGSTVADAAKKEPGPETSVGSEHVGTTVQSIYQCDVMRDYYYNTETGQWVGWASDSYVTNCVAIGSSGGGPDNCPPGDHICECSKNPSSPWCQGGGGGGNDCKVAIRGFSFVPGSLANFVVYAGPAAGGPDCEDKIPPKPCAGCKNDRKAAVAAAAADFNDCVRGWAVDTAVANCTNGFTRSSWTEDLDTAVNNNNNSGTYCYPVPLNGEPVCVYVEGFEECLAGWLYGNNASGHSVNEATTMAGSVGVKVGGGGNEVTGGIGFTDVSGQTGSVTMGPESGLYDVCKGFQNAEATKAQSDYIKCSKTATDGVNGSCNGSTPNGGTNTN